MAGAVFDQAYLAGLFDAGDVARLFSASAEVRAMLLVEGCLAKTQGAQGVLPEISAAAIHRASMDASVDAGGLAAATAQNGVVVPALVAAFREAMQAPEHAQFVHWGATSQDIIDTGLMLRLRQAADHIRTDVAAILAALARLAEAEAETPMAARTYGQQAAPTSFGAVVASWGWPLLHAHDALAALQFPISLAGAAGTATALGPDPIALRAEMAETLGLSDPNRSWHTDRTPVLEICRAFGAVVQALEKMGEDLIAMAQAELAEVALGQSGASSTMPQKQNPVAPSVLVALANMGRGLDVTLQTAATHRFQRDGAAWFTEWMTVPQIALGAAAAAKTARALAETVTPNRKALAAPLTGDHLLFAESLTFAVAKTLPRPEAQAAVKALATKARETGTPLSTLAFAKWPNLPSDLFQGSASLGTAPAEARAFARKVQTL